MKLEWARGELRLSGSGAHDGADLRTPSLLELAGPEGFRPLPISSAVEAGEGWRFSGAAQGFEATATWRPRRGSRCAYHDVALEVAYHGGEPVELGLRVRLDLAGSGRPTWLVPAAFYGENRLERCERIYPRYDYERGDPAALVSSAWSFRADRAAVPAVFAWNEGACVALATDETSGLGLCGLGFRGDAGGTSVWLDFPYREEPVTYVGSATPAPPDVQLHRWAPGETATLHFRVYLAGPDRHNYDPFVRELYELHGHEHPLNPWVGLTEAAALTAHGLHRWHYKPGDDILLETVAFDRELNHGVGGRADRPNMHVAWVSGAPYAHALLEHGRAEGQAEYAEAGARVLDKVASGLAPCGAFWGEWRGDRGWSAGWTPNRAWLQARTLAEATLFMLRALAAERARGYEHPTWEAAARSNLEFVSRRAREDGNLGAYYHAQSGEVVEWEGAGGLLWVAALVEGAALLDEPSYLEVARRAGAYYRRFVEDEFIYGAPEDVHLAPTSEDGYNAVIAYLDLFEADPGGPWLEVARRAADWTMTFRWTYNIAFPKRTTLGLHDFRSRGADGASPSNQHLHAYGLVALPEMLRLWKHTGDSYYLERTRDNLACFFQFVAREDGEFNAYRGMVTERYYHTNCFQPKGMVLTLSHAWCAGLVLYAARAAFAWAGALGLLRGEAWAALPGKEFA